MGSRSIALAAFALLAGAAAAQAPELWLLPRELRLERPPHPAPGDAPHVVALPAPGAEAHSVFLHGWRGCARAVMYAGPVRCGRGLGRETGMGLGSAFARAGVPTTFVVPQLAFRARDGSAGRFLERGYAGRFLDGLAPGLGAQPGLPVVVLAHSAGYETALSFVHRGELGARLRAVVLFDALYGGAEAFARWAAQAPGREVISFHGPGSTARESRRLMRLAAARGVAVASSLGTDAAPPSAESSPGRSVVRVMRTPVAHGEVPIRHLGEVLVHLVAKGRLSRDELETRDPSAATSP